MAVLGLFLYSYSLLRLLAHLMWLLLVASSQSTCQLLPAAAGGPACCVGC
jgi:hypothetical protein